MALSFAASAILLVGITFSAALSILSIVGGMDFSVYRSCIRKGR